MRYILVLAATLSFTLAETTIVKDPSTNLMWEDTKHVLNGVSYYEADTYCKSLTLGGHNDWRIPTLRELLSIVDYKRYEPAIIKEFNHLDEDRLYWSSTQYGQRNTEFWGIVFDDGDTDNASAVYDRRVRCVRSFK